MIFTLLNENQTIFDEYILDTKEDPSTLGFDHIYVINLDNRTDRKEKMQMIANYHNLDFDFFSAVSKDDIKTLNKYPSSLSPRHKACYVSHYKVYESIVTHGYNSSLILEDDIDLEEDIKRIVVEEVLPYLPENWELLYIGSCFAGGIWDGDVSLNGESFEYKLLPFKSPLCNHAYAVSLVGAQKLLNYLVDVDIPIDLYLRKIMDAGNITEITLIPSAITQWISDDNPSDVSPDAVPPTFSLTNSTLHLLGFKEEIVKKN
ncbi:4263_t:CDS:1 [Diversispora eburnea]|uniref:4263_t:CDS:1 n=1 Tax=Diversispora eburnea TaxID=1213867 RepID=A0A9N9A6C1_9GLOM|nr:4263_t:CDS:1 [Diversispora eburnea]